MFGWFIGRNKGFQPNTLPDLQLWLDANRIGVQGYSLDFDGTDDFVQANNVITAYPFTLECWVRLDVINAEQNFISLTKNDTNNIYYSISTDSTTGKIKIQARNTTLFSNSGNSILSANVWYHVAAVFASATDRKLYLNGVLEASGTDSVNFNANTNKVGMGVLRFTGTPTFYLNGKLSDVRIWNTARTAQQIADNYQKRLIGNESGLVGYWKLDRGTGTTVEDSTTNANTGTITGAIWDNSEPLVEAISDNTAVRVWADQSGKGYDATQSTTAARPTYIASGLNGLPVVRFDGTDDRLSIPNSTATFKFLHSDVSTVFIVAKAGVVADPNALYTFLGNSAFATTNIGYDIRWDDRLVNSANNRIQTQIVKGVSGQLVVNNFHDNSAVTPNTFHIISVLSDPANATATDKSSISINGGTSIKNNSSTSALSTSDASINLGIGTPSGTSTSSLLNGDIAEIIVYNRALNTSELAQVHRYLARKWGIQLA